jgi:diguanylate cyclase (GGDEF)-like protein
MAMLPIYLWVIMGNGLRYGLRYLYVAAFLGAIGLMAAVFASGHMEDGLYTTAGWLIAVVVLPLYVAALLRRINARTEELGRLKKHLEHLADKEPLTQLPNRRVFQTLLESRLRESPPNPKPFALAFVDLDGFKEINDRWGHTAGDEILKQTATRLQEVSRTGDVVARYGGDEFVMFLENMGPDHARTVAERVVMALSAPFVHESHCLQLSASVGVVIHRADGTDLATLMRMADEMMYDVKRGGKNAYRIRSTNVGGTVGASP